MFGRPLCPQNNQTKTPYFTGVFSDFLKPYSWCSIKDDYRTLVELEDVNDVEIYADFDEWEGNN